MTATVPDAEALTAKLLVCGEPECENQLCFHTPLLPAWGVERKLATASISPVMITPSKTCLKSLLSPPMLSHPYGIPPGVVNNLKSQTTTHFLSPGVQCILHPHGIPPRVIKFQNPNIITEGVVYPTIHRNL